MDLSRQPLQATAIAAFVYLLLAALFVVIWRRDRAPGTGWLGFAYLLLAILYANADLTISLDSQVHPVGGVIGGVANAALAAGMIRFLAAPHAPRKWLLTCAVAGALLVPIALLLGFELHRPWSRLPITVTCAAIAPAVAEAFRNTPKGQRWTIGAIFVSILAFPATYFGAVAAGIEISNAQLYILFPGLLLGLLLLAVSMVRHRYALTAENHKRMEAERALTALNASLEATVARRTAVLQNIVAGLESFNRNVSHDLQGSLGGMAGLARVAQDAVQPYGGDLTVARRVLPLIVAEAERSTQLVGTLLTLARVSDQYVHKAVVDLKALTHEVINSVSLLKPDAPMPRTIVGELPQVFADVNLLRPALANLIGNAVKFCGYRPEACVVVQARVEASTREVILQVRDNGIGFAAGEASRLFEPFIRLHGNDFAGHGVGLSIVRRAIERQGGRVWAESTLGHGASFFIALPLQPEANTGAIADAMAQVATGAKAKASPARDGPVPSSVVCEHRGPPSVAIGA